MESKKFIAYFDFMGYKDFILNNPLEYCDTRVSQILRDIETALVQGKFNQTKPGLFISDLSQLKLKCLVISDTVLFWTNDDSVESLKEFLRVTYNFNWLENLTNFPIRGAIVFDEIMLREAHTENEFGGSYDANAVYGKGLVNAHLKAENCSWAGCVIDKSVIEYIDKIAKRDEILGQYAVQYKVPYTKKVKGIKKEYVYRLVIGDLTDDGYTNTAADIVYNFSKDNKKADSKRVKAIMNNTLKFLATFKKNKNKSFCQRLFN